MAICCVADAGARLAGRHRPVHDYKVVGIANNACYMQKLN